MLREIYRAVACFISTHRTSHEGRTEHPLVFNVIYLTVAVEVHYQSAHQSVVVQMCPASHRIEVRHHAITELVVPYDGLVSRMILGSDVPHLAQRPLAMSTIERDEAAKLVPACLQLAPLGKVSILVACLVKLLLCSHITVLDTESALVHSPERDTRHRVVESCCHLCTHVFPTRANVAAPCGCAVALLASKARTGEQEHTRFVGLTVEHRALSVIYGISINRRVSIKIFCRRTECSRSA